MIDGLLLMMGVLAVTGLAAWLFMSVEDQHDSPTYVYFFDDPDVIDADQSAGQRRP